MNQEENIRPETVLDSGVNRIIKGKYGYILYSKRDTLVDASLGAYGEYGEAELDMCRQICRPGDNVAEFRSDIGAQTLGLASLVGEKGRVFAFEPGRTVFMNLCANMALNGITNVECFHAAAGAEKGKTTVREIVRKTRPGPESPGKADVETSAETRVVTLDGVLDVPKLKLIKIDANGGECDVIRGAAKTIERLRPCLYIRNDKPNVSERLIMLLFSMGYRIFWHLPLLYNPGNHAGNAANIFPKAVFVNIFCVPKNIVSTIDGLMEVHYPVEHPSKNNIGLRRIIEKNFAGALALYHGGSFPEALERFEKIVGLLPNHAGSHNYIGAIRYQNGEAETAEKSYRRALKSDPAFAEAWHNLGIVLQDLGKTDEAETAYRKALEIRPTFPNALNNLSNILAKRGETSEAEELCLRAIEADPEYAEAHYNLGLRMHDRGDADGAEAACRRALGIVPDNAEVHKALGIILLRRGDFKDGWKEYGWRWETRELRHLKPNTDKPFWRGGPLDGKTICLLREQGLGDAIQFVRFVRQVKELGARVVVLCDPKLEGLFSEIPGIDRLVTSLEGLAGVDEYCPLMNLPGILGITPETIPADVPYIAADPQIAEKWRQRFDAEKGFRVGLVWAGNPKNPRDGERSISIETLGPVFDVPDIRFYSLQVGANSGDIKTSGLTEKITDIARDVIDFREMSAALTRLDLVITADTMAAHLAGALGCPVWTLLPFIPDWRWMLDRDDTPWYPTMKLFRQKSPGDWKGVIEQVSGELPAAVATARKQPMWNRIRNMFGKPS